VFIVALSQDFIESKSCQAELQYAQALGLPILPVQVGPVDSRALNPLATVQAIDHRRPTPNTGMRLVAALHQERARRQPRPSPLPDEPPVPCDLAEHAEREPVPQGATTEGTQGAHPGVARGAVHEAEHEREPSPTRKRRRLVPIPVVTGVLAVIGGVVLAVFLSGCRGPSAGQVSTASSAPSTGERGPTEQGPYRVTATVPAGKGPSGVAVDPSTHTVYVANHDDNAVSVIDGSTRTVTATVPVGNLPVDLAVDPSTHTVYVANANDGTVSVIDGATRTVTATVPVGENESGVAVDPSTHTVYVTTEKVSGNAPATGDNMVSVIDGATRTVTATVPVGSGPRGVAVDPDTHTVYVANFWEVSVIDGSTRTVTATVPAGTSPGGGVAVDPSTHTVYVANYGDNAVSVIDGSRTVTVTATVPVGKDPYGVAVDPDTHTVYVTNRDDGTVSVIEHR
jgi:YVTN family beta-propeller protein